MGFLLSHWHCILPAAALLIGVLLLNRGRAKGGDGGKDKAGKDGGETRTDDMPKLVHRGEGHGNV